MGEWRSSELFSSDASHHHKIVSSLPHVKQIIWLIFPHFVLNIEAKQQIFHRLSLLVPRPETLSRSSLKRFFSENKNEIPDQDYVQSSDVAKLSMMHKFHFHKTIAEQRRINGNFKGFAGYREKNSSLGIDLMPLENFMLWFLKSIFSSQEIHFSSDLKFSI